MTTLKLEPQQADGGGSGGEVTREYVDQRDTATLNSAKGYTDSVASGKQNTLTAGTNITIENDVISATGSTTTVAWGGITGTLSNQTDLNSALGDKQDILTAGDNITIENNVISADGITGVSWGDIDGDLADQTDLSNALGDKADASDVGDLNDLTTGDKTDVVSAINEVNDVAIGADTKADDVNQRLTDLFTFTYKSYSDQTDPLQITCSPSSAFDSSGTVLTVAKNTDGSLAKIYGRIRLTSYNGDCIVTVSNTGLPSMDSPITLTGCALREAKFTDGRCMIYTFSYTINADGTITIPISNSTSFDGGVDVQMLACLIVVKDFGDTPEP